MNRRISWLAVGSLIAATAVAAWATSARSVTARARSEDVEPIRVAAEHFLRVFDNLEWEPFRATWAADPTVFFPFDAVPRRANGRGEVEATFRRFFDQTRTTRPGPPYLHLNPRELAIQRYGDTGIVTFMLSAPGGRVARRTLVFIRERGDWKLVHLHASTAGAP